MRFPRDVDGQLYLNPREKNDALPFMRDAIINFTSLRGYDLILPATGPHFLQLATVRGSIWTGFDRRATVVNEKLAL